MCVKGWMSRMRGVRGSGVSTSPHRYTDKVSVRSTRQQQQQRQQSKVWSDGTAGRRVAVTQRALPVVPPSRPSSAQLGGADRHW